MADAVNMNCGHGGICFDCGKSILESEIKLCHLCRQPLNYILQIDLTKNVDNFIGVISATFIEEESADNQSNEEDEAHSEGEEHNSQIDQDEDQEEE